MIDDADLFLFRAQNIISLPFEPVAPLTTVQVTPRIQITLILKRIQVIQVLMKPVTTPD